MEQRHSPDIRVVEGYSIANGDVVGVLACSRGTHDTVLSSVLNLQVERSP
ncbi:MAG: hypothetical protein ACLPVY_11305 [Acidimicrobiia bacterium]